MPEIKGSNQSFLHETKLPLEIIKRKFEQIGQTKIIAFEKTRFMTSLEVSRFLRTLPFSHLEGIQKIEWKRWQPLREFLRNPKERILGLYNQKTREIHIHGPAGMYEQSPKKLQLTITHEVGHNVYRNLEEKQPDAALRWKQIFRISLQLPNGGMVSTYPLIYRDVRIVMNEDFAETYKEYRLNPRHLKVVNMAKYEFMRREVFAGKEY